MAARKRSRQKRDLEANLYETGGYYRYKHPQTGKFHGMGKDKSAANAAARKLNAMLLKPNDHVSRVMATDAVLFSVLVTRYRNEYLPTKKLKQTTMDETGYRLNRLNKDLGHLQVCDMSIRQLAEYLDDSFKNNAYTKHRGLLSDIFKFGITKGLAESNLAEETLAKAADEKERLPLSKKWFDQIYANADEWLQVAMDFALISLQRRSDVCAARFEDIEGGYLKLVQQKTEKFGVRAHLRIEIGPSLEKVFKRSRASGIASPYIIHRRPKRIRESKDTTHWSQVRPEIFSKEFAKARDKVPEIAKLPAAKRPTVHEIRALGGHLYLEAGFSEEYVQTLMGHSTAAMTADYTDRHLEWTTCGAGLKI
ncbi:phage integrase Arm DNA-binding domain-containing protein [Marinobacterium lutimaris]|uniref:Phage integrase family protein n=1 Tax=Marinobacterium lutimaris TaxID=568106 RepID=A0A1H5YDK1_9GAMM|nr:phage integrase Arm DNA-binding domain-containing protein [Marinobacterium lutimaris]SEG22044.1 Phage integrase family protein [Marinobacterium lutimaris]